MASSRPLRNPQDSTLDLLKTVIVGGQEAVIKALFGRSVVALAGAVFILATKPGPGVVTLMIFAGLAVLFIDQVPGSKA